MKAAIVQDKKLVITEVAEPVMGAGDVRLVLENLGKIEKEGRG